MESCRKASESSTRSVTAEADTSSRRAATKVKREPATTTTNATTTTAPPIHPQGLSPSEDLRDEPGDFIETNCHWRDCGLEFPTQVHMDVEILIIYFFNEQESRVTRIISMRFSELREEC